MTTKSEINLQNKYDPSNHEHFEVLMEDNLMKLTKSKPRAKIKGMTFDQLEELDILISC